MRKTKFAFLPDALLFVSRRWERCNWYFVCHSRRLLYPEQWGGRKPTTAAGRDHGSLLRMNDFLVFSLLPFLTLASISQYNYTNNALPYSLALRQEIITSFVVVSQMVGVWDDWHSYLLFFFFFLNIDIFEFRTDAHAAFLFIHFIRTLSTFDLGFTVRVI
jgi:hypothetical protein